MSDANGDSRASSWSIGLLTRVLRHLPVGVCLASTDDQILYTNDVFDRVFGTPVGGWTGSSLRPLLSPSSPDPPWIGQSPQDRHSGEVRLQRLDGSPFPASHTFIQLDRDEGPAAHLHVIEDLTGSKQSECAIRESEERYRVVLHSIQDAVFIVNRDGTIETTNDAAAAQGYVASNRLTVGVRLDAVLPARIARRRMQAVHAVLDSRQARMIEEELTVGRSRVHLSTSVNPLTSADGTCARVVMVSRDTTADREREHFLRRFSKSLLSGQEAERKRVAGELHDGLAQSLAALIVTLRQLESELRPDDERPRERAREAADSVRALIDDARRIAHNLTPAVLEDIGLTAAIDRLLRTFFDGAGIAVDRRAIPLDNLFRPEDQIHVYRVVQEIFNNIHRHARARHVDLTIRRAGGAVEFEVRDDGVGFRVGRAASSTPADGVHLGLRGLQERARLLNGTLAIRSRPGAGTTVLLRIPASARRAAAQPSA